MSEKKVEVSYHGIGFPGLLTILFIGLKLTGHIDWDWIWVLSPIWLPFTIFFGSILFSILIILAVGTIVASFYFIFSRKK